MFNEIDIVLNRKPDLIPDHVIDFLVEEGANFLEKNHVIEESYEALSTFTEDFESVKSFGLLGGIKTDRGKDVNVSRDIDLPAYDSFCSHVHKILKAYKWKTHEWDRQIETLLVHCFRDWYDTVERPRRVEKRIWRMKKP